MKRFSANPRHLLSLDRYLGAPACFLLTLGRRLRDRLAPAAPGRPVRRILFIKLAEQGSTVLAHEAIRRATEKVGRENVYFLVFEENRFILDALELIPRDNVLAVDTRSAGALAASGLRRLAQIRRLGVDACVDLEFFARFSAALAYLTGARARVGFHTYYGEGPYRGDLLTHRVLYNSHLHASQTFTSLVLALDADPAKFPAFDVVVPPAAPPPPFAPQPEEITALRRKLEGLGVPAGAPLILLNANASDLLPLRKWDPQNYATLARRLLAEFGEVCVGFTGAPEEAAPIMEVVRAIGSPRCLCLAGQTTLRELLVLYGLAQVLVTNDSGPAHFAALTTIDVVVLFGPETPLLFAAPGPRTHVLWAGLACSPCVNAYNNRQSACRDNVCLQRLSVEQVFDAVGRIYRRKARSSP